MAGGTTGDLGYLNDRNHLFVVDRAKDMIVSGAENVYSVEVEDVLYQRCGREAAVFGDHGRGRGRVRDVVLHPGQQVTNCAPTVAPDALLQGAEGDRDIDRTPAEVRSGQDPQAGSARSPRRPVGTLRECSLSKLLAVPATNPHE